VCLGALLAVSPACSQILGIEDFSLGGDAAIGIDASGPDAQLCYTATLAPFCLTSPPTGAKTLDTALDTSMPTTCTEVIAQTTMGAPELCVIAATSITVSSTVTVSGTRPLMLLATDTISVGGTLDASSRRGVRVGAGANDPTCSAGTAPLNNASAAGGGGGGSFAPPPATKGSNGGDGNVGGLLVNNNGVSGAALAAAPTYVRGGCKGQDGGDVSATVQGGIGGAGGGAVYLYAGTSIDVAGNIFASGAGAAAAGLHAGGGGGGTGGLIALEAPMITVGGILAANGANGGSGGEATVGAVGADGATTLYSTQPAAAVNAPGGNGGRGATGAAVPVVAGNGTAGGGAGGGGGGGFGIIWVKGTFTGTQVSPAITQN